MNPNKRRDLLGKSVYSKHAFYDSAQHTLGLIPDGMPSWLYGLRHAMSADICVLTYAQNRGILYLATNPMSESSAYYGPRKDDHETKR